MRDVHISAGPARTSAFFAGTSSVRQEVYRETLVLQVPQAEQRLASVRAGVRT